MKSNLPTILIIVAFIVLDIIMFIQIKKSTKIVVKEDYKQQYIDSLKTVIQHEKYNALRERQIRLADSIQHAEQVSASNKRIRYLENRIKSVNLTKATDKELDSIINVLYE